MGPVWLTEWRAMISLNTITQFVCIIQTAEWVSEWVCEYFEVESKILIFLLRRNGDLKFQGASFSQEWLA